MIWLYLAILLLSVAGMATLRILSGVKNGAFYAKGRLPIHPAIRPFVENLHTVEAPAWYMQFVSYGAVVLLLALERGLPWYGAVVAAYLLAQGASTMASYDYQKWINRGSGLPDVDPNENPKAEFALAWPVKVSFWYPRPWYGARRRWLPLVGGVMVAAGLVLLRYA